MSVGDLNIGCCACGSGGGGTPCYGSLPNCFCSRLPPFLTMTSADPTCNFGMFQSCTISYGPHPGFESLNFGQRYYLSDQGFPDPVANGAIFHYALLCQFNQFTLTRAYLTSPYGSPFRDGILYTWLVGGFGNSCGDGTGWRINPDYLTWAACADAYLDANHPTSGGWHLADATVDPDLGCVTGQAIPFAFVDLLASCGQPPQVVIPNVGATPFHLGAGTAFPGSDPSCSVTIDG